jgi:hypothetical protein
MKIRRVHTQRIKSLYRLLILALAVAVPALAQTTTGSIYGTVFDQSDAAIPNASVAVTNVGTGETHKATSNGSGNYIFPALVPGDYTVSVESTGFSSQTQKDIRLDVNQNAHVSFSLQPGATSQSVTVMATTATVDTTESQLGETVDRQRVADLPLNGRNAYSLVQIVPGVTSYTAEAAIGDQNGASFSVNGVRTTLNSFYLDGAFDTAIYRDGGNLIPNPDAVQEFRLLTGNFDAEFGRAPGGVVNLITRSGTNQYHGLAYDYLRNNILNAKNYFQTSVTPLKQNQFGANFGGPIVRDKAFVFLSYEGLRISTPATVTSGSILLPTPTEASGDFRTIPGLSPAQVQAQFPKKADGSFYSCNGAQGVICPDLLDPVALNLLKAMPLADPTTGVSQQQNGSANSGANQGLARVDYQLNNSHKISGTFFQSRGTTISPTAGGNQILSFSGITQYTGQTNAILNDSWVVSPTKLNNLRLFFSLNHTILGNLYDNNTLSDLGSQAPAGSLLTTQPQITVSGYWHWGMGSGSSGVDNLTEQAIGVFDTFNWTFGNHNIKAGGSFVWNKYAETGGYAGSSQMGFTGSTTGNDLADFLLGNANTWRQNSGVFHRLHAAAPALFLQDDWRVLHRLTVDLGIRWEAFPPFAGQNNLGTFIPYVQSKRFPTAPLGILSAGDPGVPDGILHTSWTKFAPRVGFAYDVFGNGTTALRGAYGLFYAASQETLSGDLEQQPFLLDITVNKTPSLVTPFAPNAAPFPYVVNLQNPTFSSGGSVVSIPPNTDSIPYVQEYNLALETQLNSQWSTKITYVGSTSRKLYLSRDQNAPVYSPDASTTTAGLNSRRPYQPTPATHTFAEIQELDPAGNASYNALQATLTRRFSNGLSLLAGYVWSKTMDIVSSDPGALQLVNSNDPSLDWAVSTLNVPQRFVASYLWAVPEIHSLGIVGKQILSGWQLNGITTLAKGTPVNVTSGIDSNFDGNTIDRPNVVGNPNLPGGRGRQAKIQEDFNTAAFAQLPYGVPYGNASRNILVGPGLVNTDISAFKSFPIWEETRLQLRGEIFNVFNNVNLSNPNSTETSASFGKISTAGAARVVQFGLRYSF